MTKKSMATVIAMFCVLFLAPVAFSQAGTGNSGEKIKPKPFQFQDNSVRYVFSSWFRSPFAVLPTCANSSTHTCPAANLAKHVLGLTHVDVGNKLGDNTIDVYFTSNSTANPVSVAYFHDNTSTGTKAFYSTIRHEFVLDRLLNKNLGVGPIKNWYLEVGADLGSKDDDFSSQIRKPLIGPGVNIKVPNGGRWRLAATWTREWNEEGSDVTSWYYKNATTGVISNVSPCTTTSGCIPVPATWGEKVVYSPREFTFLTSWGVPFKLRKAPFIFGGFSTLNTSKGYGARQLKAFTGPNSPYCTTPTSAACTPVYYKSGTRPEWLTQSRLMYNFGSLFSEHHDWLIGVGYEYWHNEYGVAQNPPISPSVPSGTSQCTSCIENAPLISVEFHL